MSFNDFCANFSRIVTVEDILNDGKIDATKEFGINDHCALIEKMEACNAFEDQLDKDRVQNLSNYFVTLPSEAAMKLWSVLGKGAQENVIALHKSEASDGTKVATRLVAMLTGKS